MSHRRLAAAAQCGVGVAFAVAGVLKATQIDRFSDYLRRSGVTENFSSLVAWSIIALEGAIAVDSVLRGASEKGSRALLLWSASLLGFRAGSGHARACMCFGHEAASGVAATVVWLGLACGAVLVVEEARLSCCPVAAHDSTVRVSAIDSRVLSL